jgi:hypothetical protein
MTRTILLGMMVVLSGAIASIAAPDVTPTQNDLVGVYKCEGHNPDGSSYQGVVEIMKVQDTFRVRWTLSDDATVMGVGILSSGVLSVGYFAGAPAIAVYKIDGQRLVGEWTMGGAEGAVYPETLTKTASLPEPREPREPRKPVDKKPANFREA